MNYSLSPRERYLLEEWLPRRSKLGDAQTDARSLVASAQTLDAQEVLVRLDKVRTCLRVLRSARSSLLDVSPDARGDTVRKPNGASFTRLSPWEKAWLFVEDLQSADRFGAPFEGLSTLGSLLDASLSHGELLALTIICLETAAEGRALATAVTKDERFNPSCRAWAAWLAGDGDASLAAHTNEFASRVPEGALQAAFERRWTDAAMTLPTKFRKLIAKPAHPSGETMYLQLFAQLVTHARFGEPPREIIDGSLATVFRFFGSRAGMPWWSSIRLREAVVLLALYGRAFEPQTPGSALLHAQRRHNEHLVDPPARTFTPPNEVLIAAQRLEAILADTAAQGLGLEARIGPDDGSLYRTV